ncbi:phytanoyl-CoA dioxygenase family protein [Streptomyces sp. NPDC005336]|uniref:phytanoyl-CoA dioxygenase family protein n=1 Tax=unclassified Streptomyces TaxID=2593676 RepID=UPI0033BB4913
MDFPAEPIPPPALPCRLQNPPEFTVPIFSDIRDQFGTDGFVGPFPAVSGRDLERVRDIANKIVANGFESPLYGQRSGRDWHLVHQEFLDLVRIPEIIDQLRSLLGDDLLLWRSQMFDKEPGDGPLQWHQANLFSGEEYGNEKHSLVPANSSSYADSFGVTVWFAFDDATEENGAVKLAKGTSRKRYPTKSVPFEESVFGQTLIAQWQRTGENHRIEEMRGRSCYQATFDPEAEGVEVHTMEVPAGHYFLFNERTEHCSGPNLTDRRRLGLNFRVVRGDTLIYPDRLTGDHIDGEGYDISSHRCILLSGSDRDGRNAIAQ